MIALRAAAASLFAVGAAWCVVPGVATAAPVADCPAGSGVLVVVDFRPLGGGVQRGCDPSPTSGLTALHNAGYTTTGTAQGGEQDVCRIDELPAPSRATCYAAPPATAHWSYWHAAEGQSAWSPTTIDAADYHPPSGSIDAWVYGDTSAGGTSGQPSFTPAQVRSGALAATSAGPSAAPAGTAGAGRTLGAAPNPGTRPASAGAPGAASGGAPGGVAPVIGTATRRAPGPVPAPPGSQAVSNAGTGSSALPVGPDVVGPLRAAPTVAGAAAGSASSGSALPMIAGVTVALLLAAAAATWLVRRRRPGRSST